MRFATADRRHREQRLPVLPPLHCSACPIREHTIYKRIIEVRPLAVESLRTTRVHYPKGHLLRAQGETDTNLFTLFSGWALRFRISRGGRRQILSFHLPGDLIGLEAIGASQGDFGVRALTEVALCKFESGSLISLLLQPGEASINTLATLLRHNGAIEDTAIARGQGSAMERMALLFLNFRERLLPLGMAAEDNFPLPLRRDDFADALGLTPVHVSRTMAVLRRERVLEFRRGTLRILDDARLREIAAGHANRRTCNGRGKMSVNWYQPP